MSIPLPEPAKASQGLARPWAWFPGGNQAMRRALRLVHHPHATRGAHTKDLSPSITHHSHPSTTSN